MKSPEKHEHTATLWREGDKNNKTLLSHGLFGQMMGDL